MGIMSLYPNCKQPSCCVDCSLQMWATPENTQGFEYVCIIIDEGVLWRAPRILADGPLEVAVTCKVCYRSQR